MWRASVKIESDNYLSKYVRMYRVPIGQNAINPLAGDFILCHRRGFVSWAIRTGERIKTAKGAVVSHAAFVESPDTLIEALARGVVRTPLEAYKHIEYWHVTTLLSAPDQAQALQFAQSCVGQRYGFLTDLGIGLRFITPGRGLWFGSDGTQICSGLVAQTQVRGWVNYKHEPASMSPADLFEHYDRS